MKRAVISFIALGCLTSASLPLAFRAQAQDVTSDQESNGCVDMPGHLSKMRMLVLHKRHPPEDKDDGDALDGGELCFYYGAHPKDDKAAPLIPAKAPVVFRLDILRV